MGRAASLQAASKERAAGGAARRRAGAAHRSRVARLPASPEHAHLRRREAPLPLDCPARCARSAAAARRGRSLLVRGESGASAWRETLDLSFTDEQAFGLCVAALRSLIYDADGALAATPPPPAEEDAFPDVSSLGALGQGAVPVLVAPTADASLEELFGGAVCSAAAGRPPPPPPPPAPPAVAAAASLSAGASEEEQLAWAMAESTRLAPHGGGGGGNGNGGGGAGANPFETCEHSGGSAGAAEGGFDLAGVFDDAPPAAVAPAPATSVDDLLGGFGLCPPPAAPPPPATAGAFPPPVGLHSSLASCGGGGGGAAADDVDALFGLGVGGAGPSLGGGVPSQPEAPGGCSLSGELSASGVWPPEAAPLGAGAGAGGAVSHLGAAPPPFCAAGSHGELTPIGGMSGASLSGAAMTPFDEDGGADFALSPLGGDFALSPLGGGLDPLGAPLGPPPAEPAAVAVPQGSGASAESNPFAEMESAGGNPFG